MNDLIILLTGLTGFTSVLLFLTVFPLEKISLFSKTVTITGSQIYFLNSIVGGDTIVKKNLRHDTLDYSLVEAFSSDVDNFLNSVNPRKYPEWSVIHDITTDLRFLNLELINNYDRKDEPLTFTAQYFSENILSNLKLIQKNSTPNGEFIVFLLDKKTGTLVKNEEE